MHSLFTSGDTEYRSFLCVNKVVRLNAARSGRLILSKAPATFGLDIMFFVDFRRLVFGVDRDSLTEDETMKSSSVSPVSLPSDRDESLLNASVKSPWAVCMTPS